MSRQHRYPDDEIVALYRAIAERRDMRHFLPDPFDPQVVQRLLHIQRAQTDRHPLPRSCRGVLRKTDAGAGTVGRASATGNAGVRKWLGWVNTADDYAP
jgi:hypothetical protein